MCVFFLFCKNLNVSVDLGNTAKALHGVCLNVLKRIPISKRIVSVILPDTMKVLIENAITWTKLCMTVL